MPALHHTTSGRLSFLFVSRLYRNLHLMKLLKYQFTPIILSNTNIQHLLINPKKKILAVDNASYALQRV